MAKFGGLEYEAGTDMVYFPKRTTVVVAHTAFKFSVGWIIYPNSSTTVAWFEDPITKSSSPYDFLSVKRFLHLEEGSEWTAQLLSTWCHKKGVAQEGLIIVRNIPTTEGFQLREPDLLRGEVPIPPHIARERSEALQRLKKAGFELSIRRIDNRSFE